MLNKNVEVFMGCDTGWHFASTVLFGAPFDSTTSYRPGTRFGSGAIRRESYGIESYSPYQDRDLLDGDVVDIGDIELCFGDSAAALESITQQTRRILALAQAPLHAGRRTSGDLGRLPCGGGKVSRTCTSSTLTPTPTCGTTIWAFLSPTPASCAAAGSLWATAASSSSASAPGDREEFSWGRTHVRTNRFNFDSPGGGCRAAAGQTGLLHPRPGCAGSVGLSRHRHAGTGWCQL